MKVRVFQNPDGSVRILRINPKHVTDSTADLDKEMAKNNTMRLPYKDIDEHAIPSDRTLRHKFRLNGNRVEVDHAVPDRPDTPSRP